MNRLQALVQYGGPPSEPGAAQGAPMRKASVPLRNGTHVQTDKQTDRRHAQTSTHTPILRRHGGGAGAGGARQQVSGGHMCCAYATRGGDTRPLCCTPTRFVVVDGLNVHYKRMEGPAGPDGITLVMLHGFGTAAVLHAC